MNSMYFYFLKRSTTILPSLELWKCQISYNFSRTRINLLYFIIICYISLNVKYIFNLMLNILKRYQQPVKLLIFLIYVFYIFNLKMILSMYYVYNYFKIMYLISIYFDFIISISMNIFLNFSYKYYFIEIKKIIFLL